MCSKYGSIFFWLKAQAVARGEPVQRSDKIILVKNLPYTADRDELLSLFSQYGEVQQLELPESQYALVRILSAV